MSDRDTDPMDKAYARAEALIDDEAARAARRARVLSAVSEVAPAADTSPPRRTAWRPAGWLAAASVAGISLFVAIQINRPPVIERPGDPPVPAPAIEPPAASAPTSPPPAVAPQERRVDAPLAPLATPAPAEAAPSEIVVEAAKRSPSFQDAPVAVEARALPVAPPPPPPPAAAAAPPMGRLVRPAAPASPRAQPSTDLNEISEMVVTGARQESATSPEALAQRLRDAAAAGQSREISVLLAREVPIDAVDDEGETALMKAVEARQLDAVALLRRRGANLDLKNNAGRSVRDLAAAAGDRELNKALGLDR